MIDAELTKAREALTAGGAPLETWVKDVTVDSTEDVAGDEALVIYVLIDAVRLADGEALSKLRAALQERLAAAGVRTWSYVRFQDADEPSAD